MSALVAEREADGPFASLADFAERLDGGVVNKRQVEALACAGAFDTLEPVRRRAFEAAETLVRHAQVAASERESQQSNLFGGADMATVARLPLPVVGDWDALERLQQEFDAIGFYLSAHPLDGYGPALKSLGVKPSSAIDSVPSGATAKVAGIVIGRQERTSRQGNRFAFVQFSDTEGLFEVMLFSELLGRSRELLEGSAPLIVTLQPRGEDADRRLIAQELQPLEQAASNAMEELRVFLHDPEPIASLRTILESEGKARSGRGRVAFVLGLADGREAEVALPGRYRLSPGLCRAIKSLPGVVLQDL